MRLALCIAAMLVAACSYDPMGGNSANVPVSAVARLSSASSIPVFKTSFTYQNVNYPLMIVGSNPFTSPASTTIDVAIVPLRLVFAGGSTLDATSVAADLPKSPLFTTGSYPAGKTQYGDAEMRSEFWSAVGKGSKTYHVLLNTPAVEPTFTLDVPSADGHAAASGGGTEGYLAYSWFIQKEELQIIEQLGIPPSTLTIFDTVDTRVLQPGNVCCYSGFHYRFTVTTPSGTKKWTTAWASTTATHIDSLSHEIGEWLNDPYYSNFVPHWREPGESACGGQYLEVGDPVTTHSFIVNGFVVQDLVFYSWFTRTKPSIGIDGRYDLLGILSGPALSCT